MRYKKRKQRRNDVSAFLNPKKCPKTGKTMFATEDMASRSMMRMWSHDPQANIHDLHTYVCPDCLAYHVGHISYFQQAQARNESQSQANP
jgi:hypothetical protein